MKKTTTNERAKDTFFSNNCFSLSTKGGSFFYSKVSLLFCLRSLMKNKVSDFSFPLLRSISLATRLKSSDDKCQILTECFTHQINQNNLTEKQQVLRDFNSTLSQSSLDKITEDMIKETPGRRMKNTTLLRQRFHTRIQSQRIVEYSTKLSEEKGTHLHMVQKCSMLGFHESSEG